MQVAQVDFIFGDAPAEFERGDEELAGDRAFYVSFLISDWGRHGQHVSDGHPFLEIERGRRVWLRVPDVDSLEPKHDDHHAAEHREKLRGLNVSIEIQMLGADLDDERPTSNDRTREICRCEKRSSLILFNRFYSQEIPLRCGDCFGLVPLYNIPFEDVKQYEPYDDLYSWQRNYNGCDTLQLGCTLAEHWALRQMGRHKSQLSKQGRKLCRRLEKLLNVPVYYSLHRYYGKSWKREERRKCPRCHSDWKLPEELHGGFHFRCGKCRLLSNIAYWLED
jgi:predicted  nucleic acid-binding Zn ribbon protein